METDNATAAAAAAVAASRQLFDLAADSGAADSAEAGAGADVVLETPLTAPRGSILAAHGSDNVIESDTEPVRLLPCALLLL